VGEDVSDEYVDPRIQALEESFARMLKREMARYESDSKRWERAVHEQRVIERAGIDIEVKQAVERATTLKACMGCRGPIGPDLTGRPMCYRCGPADMLPKWEPYEYETTATAVASAPSDSPRTR